MICFTDGPYRKPRFEWNKDKAKMRRHCSGCSQMYLRRWIKIHIVNVSWWLGHCPRRWAGEEADEGLEPRKTTYLKDE